MRLRVIFMGMLGAFSAIPLERLLAAHVELIAVVAPSPQPTGAPIQVMDPPAPLSADLPLEPRERPNIVALAHRHAIPVLAVAALRHPQTLSLFRALQPDLIAVACFPFILPKSLLRLPTYGCFNLHPSLLPKLRGPAPLFWVFHEGCCAGVTLHQMSERVDAGDIVAQMPLEFPNGITYAEAEHVCAQWGARLLMDAIHVIERGRLSPRPQAERKASYFPYPAQKDFVITADWSARRAYNFMRGIEGFGGPALMRVANQTFVLREAIAYELGKPMMEAYRIEGDQVWVRCADGVVQVRAH